MQLHERAACDACRRYYVSLSHLHRTTASCSVILQQVLFADYNALYGQQIKERKSFDYPPFYRLIRISLKARDYQRVDQAAQWLFDVLNQQVSVPVLGPVDPLVARVRNQYIKQILIKFRAYFFILISKIFFALLTFEDKVYFKYSHLVKNE